MLDDATRHVLVSTPEEGVVAALRELGWFEIRAEDRPVVEGGFFELQGECLATSGVLDAVLVEALDVRAEVAVLHPVPGARGGPGTVDGSPLRLDGLIVAPGRPEAVLVPLPAGRRVTLADAELAGLEIVPIEGFDPWLGWRRVRGTVALGDLDVVDRGGDSASRSRAAHSPTS